jgi:hypothetical protein
MDHTSCLKCLERQPADVLAMSKCSRRIIFDPSLPWAAIAELLKTAFDEWRSRLLVTGSHAACTSRKAKVLLLREG